MIIFKRKIFSILTIFILIVFSLMLLLAISLIRDIKTISQEFVLERKTLVTPLKSRKYDKYCLEQPGCSTERSKTMC